MRTAALAAASPAGSGTNRYPPMNGKSAVLVVAAFALAFIVGGYLTRPDEEANLCPACRMKVPLGPTIGGHCRAPFPPV